MGVAPMHRCNLHPFDIGTDPKRNAGLFPPAFQTANFVRERGGGPVGQMFPLPHTTGHHWLAHWSSVATVQGSRACCTAHTGKHRWTRTHTFATHTRVVWWKPLIACSRQICTGRAITELCGNFQRGVSSGIPRLRPSGTTVQQPSWSKTTTTVPQPSVMIHPNCTLL